MCLRRAVTVSSPPITALTAPRKQSQSSRRNTKINERRPFPEIASKRRHDASKNRQYARSSIVKAWIDNFSYLKIKDVSFLKLFSRNAFPEPLTQIFKHPKRGEERERK